MAGLFTLGERKIRPGAYFNIQKVGDEPLAGSVDGITAVLFQSDWGPLGKVVAISKDEGYEAVFGKARTTDAIAEVFNGGAQTALCYRLGSDGKAAKVVLKNNTIPVDDAVDVVTITANYVGARSFTVSVGEHPSDGTRKECIIYQNGKVFEKVAFAAGGDEAGALAKAFQNSVNFEAACMAEGLLANISNETFEAGENPAVDPDESYSKGFEAVERYFFNTICVDTEDPAVHRELASNLDRIFQIGQLGMAVVAEKKEVLLEERIQHAYAFNDEKIIYVLNSSIESSSANLEGYQTAARIAGMVAACPSGQSLTHTVISGVTELVDRLTPTQIIEAEQSGCLVLSVNSRNQIWIDSAINTLVTPKDNQDEGWKKIRRTKTRYELLTRANTQADSLIGKVDNDANGRATIVSQIQGIGMAMVEEGKLISCNVTESEQYKAESDSCWFDIDVVDKDSAERIYLTFRFRFATQE